LHLLSVKISYELHQTGVNQQTKKMTSSNGPYQ
jgi:hypothetical protein